MPAAASGTALPGPSVDASATPAIPPNLDPLDWRRVLMTTGCRDCDDLPKQDDAGSIVRDADGEFQIMHNGLQVVAGGYCGAWMTEIMVSRNHPTNSLFRELEYDLNEALVRLERYQRWFNWLPWNWRRRRRLARSR